MRVCTYTARPLWRLARPPTCRTGTAFCSLDSENVVSLSSLQTTPARYHYPFSHRIVTTHCAVLAGIQWVGSAITAPFCILVDNNFCFFYLLDPGSKNICSQFAHTYASLTYIFQFGMTVRRSLLHSTHLNSSAPAHLHEHPTCV